MAAITGSIEMSTVTGSIEMSTVARKFIVKEILINNNSTVEWLIRCSIRPINDQCGGVTDCMFNRPPFLHIPPKQTVNDQLYFQPKKGCDAKDELVLLNQTLQSIPNCPPGEEKTTYNLRGIGEDPPAEGTINIDYIDRIEIKKRINVPPIRYEVITKYRVVCDVFCYSGERINILYILLYL